MGMCMQYTLLTCTTWCKHVPSVFGSRCSLCSCQENSAHSLLVCYLQAGNMINGMEHVSKVRMQLDGCHLADNTHSAPAPAVPPVWAAQCHKLLLAAQDASHVSGMLASGSASMEHDWWNMTVLLLC